MILLSCVQGRSSLPPPQVYFLDNYIHIPGGGIYRVESDFGGIYRVAVYIGSVAPKGPLRGIYRVYIK